MNNNSISEHNWIPAHWPAPTNIHAGTTTRLDGDSRPPYDRFNLAMHVGDNPAHVDSNRSKLRRNLRLPSDPVWLAQTHSNLVITATPGLHDPAADGACTEMKGVVCAVLTADCLPLLLCNETGTRIAAIHVGWKGYCAGIVTNAIRMFRTHERLLAWLGPCIRAENYEIGSDVYEACVRSHAEAACAFVQSRPGHWLADLALLVKINLNNHGVDQIFDSMICTYTRKEHFFSYRRSGITGRMASLIWMENS